MEVGHCYVGFLIGESTVHLISFQSTVVETVDNKWTGLVSYTDAQIKLGQVSSSCKIAHFVEPLNRSSFLISVSDGSLTKSTTIGATTSMAQHFDMVASCEEFVRVEEVVHVDMSPLVGQLHH